MAEWDPFEDRPDLLGGRYRIAEVLGTGGAGCVYRAVDEQTRHRVALKLVEAPSFNRPLRFLAEARDMARLDHPRVVRVLDLGHDRHWYWFVMELMDSSLKDRIERDGPQTPADALRLIYEVLQGLHAVHSASLVHRDIKPHNILMDRRGRPKLTDFGLARHAAGDVPWRTRTGESLGSPAYCAPEQAQNPTSAGREADIYGVGGVLYFTMTGKRPKPFYMMTDEEFDEELATVPPSVRAVIRRSMSNPPDKRFRSAVEMAAGIAKAYDALPERAGRTPVAKRWIREFDAVEEAPVGLWGRMRAWFGGSTG
ncbi:MAG: serine/threonine-protein kinase [Myxococcota bacterium]